MWAAATLAIAILRSIFALGRPPISEDIRQLILRMATDALPPRPEARQGDPEGAIQRRETRPPVPMGVDRELLSQCQLDDRLILSASEEREDATEDRDRESGCRPHRGSILAESATRRQAESRLGAALPLVDDGDHPWRKHEQNQRG